MNYFDILDLRAEPFSNSPDPDFLYRSRGHEQCLHNLEIALRLRRGLSVVLGEVGTGKTTLCRELLRVLAEDETVTAHLVLDPGFSTPGELLAVLHGLFYQDKAAGALSEWQLKEDIKNALFASGVDRDGLVVLIIDEGQKLPANCLEILRELLNYETNDRKLLQIVIFAQTEFRGALNAMPNLADRVNDLISLAPLSIAETKAMVRHRLDTAKAGYARPEVFTALGYLALHRATGGYPRRIVRLGHKVVLALILNRRSKAGWRAVYACARAGGQDARPKTKLLVPAAALVCLLAVLAWPAYIRSPQEPEASTVSAGRKGETANTPVALQTASTVPARPFAGAPQTKAESEEAAIPAPALAPPASAPEFLGQVAMQEGENLSTLTRLVYGSFNRGTLSAMLEANPEVSNPDRVEVGDVLRFPSKAMDFQRRWWTPLAEAGTLAEAVALRRNGRFPDDTKILAHRDESGALRFALTPEGALESEADARRAAASQDKAPSSGWVLVPRDPARAALSGPRPPADAEAAARPKFLGRVDARSDEDVPMLARLVYGDAGTQTLSALRAANPGLDASGRLRPGETIRFPLADMTTRRAWWAMMAQARTLAGAVALWRAAPFLPSARVLAWSDGRGGLRYAVAAGPPAASEDEARRNAAKDELGVELVQGTILARPAEGNDDSRRAGGGKG